MASRVLVIGLDGATWDVLDPWIRDGTLPHLGRLRQGGSWGNLRSTIPPLTAPAWSSFMTGKRPGKHGVFHFVDVFREEQDNQISLSPTGAPRGTGDSAQAQQIVNARSIKSPLLWDILGHHERKVGLINIPMTYPPRPVDGFMITGLLTPKNAPTFTYPAELGQELADYVIDLDRFSGRMPFQDEKDFDSDIVAPTLALVQEFRDMMEKRGRTSLSLMQSRPWDFMMVVFTGTDRMGHYLWPYHFPPSAGRAPERGSKLEAQSPTGREAQPEDPAKQRLYEAIRAYYVRLDEVIHELINTAGNDTTVIILSDHGMGPIYNRRAHWNFWLHQHGWLAVEETSGAVANPDKLLRRLGLPRDKVGRILRRMPGLFRSRAVQKAVASTSATVDKARSKAYAVPIHSFTFGIRINAQGEERERLRDEITAALKATIDPVTGDPIVQDVYRGEEYFYGPYAHNIPDIIAVADPAYTSGYRVSHYSSVATPMEAPVANAGDHRMDGIFLAYGPQIKATVEPLSGLMLEDVAPSILHLMGLPVPSDMDGRVLTEVLSPHWLARGEHAVQMGAPTGYWPNPDEVVFSDQPTTAEDEEQIRERLRALGYL